MAMTLKEFEKQKRKPLKSHKISKSQCDCIDCYYLKHGKKLDEELENNPIAMPRKVRGT